ncbi:condensation domain-containing protein, partial [Lysinibacillus xylanilyticus]|uniref:condensation domain-containing protein n=1 Tax=Lysinibacillus xylanilyticus TaxID=582475 RepID=UPI0037FD843E
MIDLMVYKVREKDTNFIELEKEYWNKIVCKDYDKVNFKKFNDSKRNKKIVNLKIDPSNSTNLINMCKNDDMLLYFFILMVFKITINKYTQSTNFLIGIPQYIKADEKADDEKSKNLFIVLDNGINQENSFKEEIIRARKEILDAYVYQFHDLQELYMLNDVHNKVNVYCCMKNIHNFSQLENILHLSNNELTLVVEKNANSIGVEFNYWDSSISNEIEIITSMFINVLNNIIKNVLIKIKDIEIVSTEEKHNLLVEFNNTAVDYLRNKTINELFEE